MENRWRAKRSGVHTAFIVEGYDRPVSIEQWLFMAEQILGETARALGVENVFSQLRRIIREGTSAERQRNVYEEAIGRGGSVHEALSEVVDHLLMETAKARAKTAPTKLEITAIASEFLRGKTASLNIHKEDGTVPEERAFPRAADPRKSKG